MKGIYTVLLCVSSVVYSSWGYAADKVALIIGNSEYKSVADNLKNPVNDAKSLQKILQAAGYQTNLVLNANLDASSYVFEGSSHTCLTKIIDGTITWQFYNINLLFYSK